MSSPNRIMTGHQIHINSFSVISMLARGPASGSRTLTVVDSKAVMLPRQMPRLQVSLFWTVLTCMDSSGWTASFSMPTIIAFG